MEGSGSSPERRLDSDAPVGEQGGRHPPSVLLPFTRRPWCVKCESRTVDFHYCRSSHAGRYSWDEVAKEAPEHLDVVCQECLYLWFTVTADHWADAPSK